MKKENKFGKYGNIRIKEEKESIYKNKEENFNCFENYKYRVRYSVLSSEPYISHPPCAILFLPCYPRTQLITWISLHLSISYPVNYLDFLTSTHPYTCVIIKSFIQFCSHWNMDGVSLLPFSVNIFYKYITIPYLKNELCRELAVL